MQIFFVFSKLDKCPDGFLEHAEKCYKISTDKLSWHEARFECLGLDGNYDLAIVDNLELFEFLKSYTNHWIGLYSQVGKRTFKWIDNTKVEFGKTEKQKPWAPSQPNVRPLFSLSYYSNLFSSLSLARM